MMTTSKTTRLQDYTNHKGLALCGHITLDVTARWWVPVNTHGTPAPQRREAVGSPQIHKRLQAANKTQTLTWLRSRFVETADLRSQYATTEVGDKNTFTSPPQIQERPCRGTRAI